MFQITIEELIALGIDDMDHITGQMSSNTLKEMSAQLINKKNKKNKNKNKNKSNKNSSNSQTTVGSIAAADQQHQLQQQQLLNLVAQMQQHLQQQQQQQPSSNYGASNFQDNLSQYGNNDLPNYNPTNRPFQSSSVTFQPGLSQYSPSERPVSASFPYTPVQNSVTQRPIQNQYVSTSSFNDGLPEYSAGQAQYGSSSFSDGLAQYTPTQRPNLVSTVTPIEQAQYSIVSTPSQAQYGQTSNQNQAQYGQTNNQNQAQYGQSNNQNQAQYGQSNNQNQAQYGQNSNQNQAQYGQGQGLPEYFGGSTKQPSNFRGSASGENWFPVPQNQPQSSYVGSTPTPSTYGLSTPAISFEESRPGISH